MALILSWQHVGSWSGSCGCVCIGFWHSYWKISSIFPGWLVFSSHWNLIVSILCSWIWLNSILLTWFPAPGYRCELGTNRTVNPFCTIQRGLSWTCLSFYLHSSLKFDLLHLITSSLMPEKCCVAWIRYPNLLLLTQLSCDCYHIL